MNDEQFFVEHQHHNPRDANNSSIAQEVKKRYVTQDTLSISMRGTKVEIREDDSDDIDI